VNYLVKTRQFFLSSVDRTSAINVATRAQDTGGIADCILVHSMDSFLFNALMSCSTESSRTGSGAMVVVANRGSSPITGLSVVGDSA